MRGLPEYYGELPASCLAEESETPGQGQVQALITLAGNPVLSAPNSQHLQQALRIASEHSGTNTNILTDDAEIDPLSGNAALSGLRVKVCKAVGGPAQ